MNRRYAQLAQPSSRRRVAAALLVIVTGMVATATALGAVLAATGLLEVLLATTDVLAAGPVALAVTALAVPALALPPAVLAAWAVLGLSPRRVCSVTGRFRWGWFGRCLLLTLVVVGMATAAMVAATGLPDAAPTADWPLRLVVIVAVVPPAAFAEEFLFRGVLTLVLGARWAGPARAVVAAAVPTSVVFAISHGGVVAPSAFAGFVVAGLTYSLLCDRTGGLEASTAAHVVWNVSLFAAATLFPAGAAAATGVGGLLQVIAVDALLVVVLVAAARRRGILTTVPADRAPVPAAVPA